jgi:DNA-binding transcriptional ArsR family regulator
MTQTYKDMTSCCPELADVLSPKIFKALCDSTRLTLLCSLASCCSPRSVSEIATCCPIDLSVVSRHLGILRDAGILDAEKQGKHVYYSVRARELAARLRGIADALERCCPSQDEERDRK